VLGEVPRAGVRRQIHELMEKLFDFDLHAAPSD
jgi:hypothetical protein